VKPTHRDGCFTLNDVPGFILFQMKKFSLIAVLFAALAVTACGKKEEAPVAAPAPAVAPADSAAAPVAPAAEAAEAADAAANPAADAAAAPAVAEAEEKKP
jgi:hypothetical protein